MVLEGTDLTSVIVAVTTVLLCSVTLAPWAGFVTFVMVVVVVVERVDDRMDSTFDSADVDVKEALLLAVLSGKRDASTARDSVDTVVVVVVVVVT